jgi:hypothetical protein
MLSCHDFAHHYAGDYLDEQLGLRARIRVGWHLLSCDHCRRFIAQLKKVRGLMRKRMQSAANADSATQKLAEKLAAIYIERKNSSPPL